MEHSLSRGAWPIFTQEAPQVRSGCLKSQRIPPKRLRAESASICGEANALQPELPGREPAHRERPIPPAVSWEGQAHGMRNEIGFWVLRTREKRNASSFVFLNGTKTVRSGVYYFGSVLT